MWSITCSYFIINHWNEFFKLVKSLLNLSWKNKNKLMVLGIVMMLFEHPLEYRIKIINNLWVIGIRAIPSIKRINRQRWTSRLCSIQSPRFEENSLWFFMFQPNYWLSLWKTLQIWFDNVKKREQSDFRVKVFSQHSTISRNICIISIFNESYQWYWEKNVMQFGSRKSDKNFNSACIRGNIMKKCFSCQLFG